MSLLKQVHQSATTASDGTQQEEKGLRRIDPNGKEYVYCQADTALAQGYMVGGLSSTTAATNYKVTPDISKCSVKYPVGVALGTISDEHFCYIQQRGRNTHVKTNGSVAAGSTIWWSADMVCRPMAAGQEHLGCGFSRAADSGSIATFVHLNGCLGF